VGGFGISGAGLLSYTTTMFLVISNIEKKSIIRFLDKQ
jgi:hypothetical protein